jgi:predicted MFS family arabinose efflux permease
MRYFLFAVTDEGTRQAWDTTETWALVRIGVLIVLLVLVFGWLVDWRRRRADEAMALQARVSDALMQEPDLAWTAVTAVARVPVWPAAPTALEVRGQVTTPEARDAAIRTALRVLERHPGRVRLEDRLWVDPAPQHRLAA